MNDAYIDASSPKNTTEYCDTFEYFKSYMHIAWS